MTWPTVPLAGAIVKRRGSVTPQKYPDEEFELYSVPAFDSRQPDLLAGHAIGSAKQLVEPGDVLLSKIVPHIRRAWIVGERTDRRMIASGEWIVFKSEEFAPEYLRHLLLGDEFHARMMQTVAGVGGSLLRARPEQVGAIMVPLPPLAEQRRIASILDQAETLRAKRRETVSRVDELVHAVFLDMFATAGDLWPELTIEEVAAPRKGSIRTGPFGSQLLHEEFTDDGIAVLGIDNAVRNRFEWARPRFITPEKYQQLSRYTVYPGDVLITIMGTNGRCAIVPEGIPAAINTKHLCCITLDINKVSPVFVHSYFLYHPIARSYLRGKAKGAIMAGLNMGIIKELPIRLPPLALQQDFARRCDAIAAHRTVLSDSLKGADALFVSLQSRASRGEL
ncbi:restriction endonuclease subunit S [Williamsia sp.]|uniref:restriction endonuclease subunit S n=1 Tax=Williamsia sp. TaxID=1872085 RepID=UPI002F95ABA6